MMNENRGFAHVLVLVLVLLVLVGAVGYYLLMTKGTINIPFMPAQKATVSLQTQYENPFDKNTQYANPFSQYKNPFDTAK